LISVLPCEAVLLHLAEKHPRLFPRADDSLASGWWWENPSGAINLGKVFADGHHFGLTSRSALPNNLKSTPFAACGPPQTVSF
jgi:glutathione S-transferase